MRWAELVIRFLTRLGSSLATALSDRRPISSEAQTSSSVTVNLTVATGSSDSSAVAGAGPSNPASPVGAGPSNPAGSRSEASATPSAAPPSASSSAPARAPAPVAESVAEQQVRRATEAGASAAAVLAGTRRCVAKTPPRPGGVQKNHFYVIIRSRPPLAYQGIITSWPDCAVWVSGASGAGIAPQSIFHGFSTKAEALAYWRAALPDEADPSL